jgi:hypothetical protein
MTTTNIVLALISLTASLLTIYAFIQSALIKFKEKQNVEEMKNLIVNIYDGVENIHQKADRLVQLPKERKVNTEEWQEHARKIRFDALMIGRRLKRTIRELETWEPGNIIKSEDLTKNDEVTEEEKKSSQ